MKQFYNTERQESAANILTIAYVIAAFITAAVFCHLFNY